MSSTHTELPENLKVELGSLVAHGFYMKDDEREKAFRESVAKIAALLQKTAQEAELRGRIDEQKVVSEWLVDAEHVDTVRDFNRLRRIKLEAARSQHNSTETSHE